MSTFVLIHGAGSGASYWHLVQPRLEAAGHVVVAVDLPCDDDRAGLAEYLATAPTWWWWPSPWEASPPPWWLTACRWT